MNKVHSITASAKQSLKFSGPGGAACCLKEAAELQLKGRVLPVGYPISLSISLAFLRRLRLTSGLRYTPPFHWQRGGLLKIPSLQKPHGFRPLLKSPLHKHSRGGPHSASRYSMSLCWCTPRSSKPSDCKMLNLHQKESLLHFNVREDDQISWPIRLIHSSWSETM